MIDIMVDSLRNKDSKKKRMKRWKERKSEKEGGGIKNSEGARE